MPRKPKSPCRHPGCPELTEDRFCKQHQQEYRREYNREQRPEYSRKLYRSSRWRKLRRRFQQENPLCEECKKVGRLIEATVVDHIIPHKGDEMLFWDIDNLQALCKPCHDRKTAAEGRWGEKGRVYRY
ncbi:MAG: HNH endonuclease signature motif containing protein [Syntrophales bacterium]|nr:HNH endonuclease signature motif containing protein [Syntrophales bacterium]